MFIKNALILLLVRLVNLFIRPNQTGNILVVSTTALGDTLWATPAIENLRKAYPDKKIYILTSKIGLEIFPSGAFCTKNWFFLRSLKIETVYIFHTSQRYVLPLVATIGARQIIGTKGQNKGLDALLTKAIPSVYEHEIARRIRITDTSAYTETISFPLTETPRKREGKWIALHPGAKDVFKRYPLFAELGRLLPYNILITGTEKDLMQKLASEIPNAVIDNPNQTLKEFAATLKEMDLFITNDTGPMHLAAALNVPTIALFSATDPNLCGPYKAKNVHVIAKSPTCTPCIKKKCRKPFCLLQISPQEIYNMVQQIL